MSDELTIARWIAAFWSEELGFPDIDEETNFYAVGGHSLLAMRTAIELTAEHGLRVEASAVMRNPTPRALAAVAVASPVRGEDTGDGDPSPGQ